SVCLTKRLSRHSATRQSVERTQPKVFPPSAPSGRTRLPNPAATLMFDLCPLVRAPTAASARVILDSTLQRTITRLGADHRAALLGQGSQGFDALDTMRRRGGEERSAITTHGLALARRRYWNGRGGRSGVADARPLAHDGVQRRA